MTTDKTLDDVAATEQRIVALRGDLAEERSLLAEAERRLAGTFKGKLPPEDTGALEQAVAAHERRVKGMAAAITELTNELTSDRVAAHQAEGARRELGAKRALGSLVTVRAEDAAKMEEAAAAFRAAADQVNSRTHALERLWAERLVLAHVFGDSAGLEAPPAPFPLWPRKLAALPYRPASAQSPWCVQRVVQLLAGTPTAALLDLHGWGLLKDRRGWDAAQQAATQERGRAHDRKRVEERTQYDAWLAAQLADGPVLLDKLKQRATADGLQWHPATNHPSCSVVDASERLGVVGLQETSEGPVWWAVGGHDVDGERFHPLRTGTPLGALRW